MRHNGNSLAVSGAYVWIAMVAFGGIAVETIVIYPNVFHDAPASLAKSMEFFVITGPADFFPPMGAVTVVAAAVTLLLLRRARQARWWIAGSLATLLVGEFLFSVLFFWPRNDIMFEEGLAVHSVEFLRQTAVEFETGHWFRLTFSAVTATAAFIGFLRYHRARTLSGGLA
ncbi:anthrone oxygenase family protein [Amycolatopsis coloradensis]|uniref:Anthrone oxygenase family protein n=1 Tax=Amycolatopsis coloradensis TaxID=76021 RepID=A0ACD5BJ59_9PSEU